MTAKKSVDLFGIKKRNSVILTVNDDNEQDIKMITPHPDTRQKLCNQSLNDERVFNSLEDISVNSKSMSEDAIFKILKEQLIQVQPGVNNISISDDTFGSQHVVSRSMKKVRKVGRPRRRSQITQKLVKNVPQTTKIESRSNEVHNENERVRRKELSDAFVALKAIIPGMKDISVMPKVQILQKATEAIHRLKQKVGEAGEKRKLLKERKGLLEAALNILKKDAEERGCLQISQHVDIVID